MRLFSSLFKKQPTAEDVKILTDKLLEKDDFTNGQREDEIDNLISIMSQVVKNIKSKSNGYPNNSINAQVWLSGFGLINSTHLLYEKLSATDYDAKTEKVADLWAESTLTVCAHYHHMVGPSMIAAAKMKEKMGKNEIALNYYSAIINDFQNLVELNFEEDPITQDEITSLKSLKQALTRSGSIDKNLINSNEELLNKVDTILDDAK